MTERHTRVQSPVEKHDARLKKARCIEHFREMYKKDGLSSSEALMAARRHATRLEHKGEDDAPDSKDQPD